ncbi:hypothetical protein ZIOFF_000281 [Zingiber officinale]|uniref:Retrotransposon Copia-like N-terminal domain-containing protein n=1 Tax=Zingiber officinale TaxID=94328 RepID=A0A8J5HTH8_ZINOF|nr:hypothetical protein ZIOFF_000281 [Zingiber officinale]
MSSETSMDKNVSSSSTSKQVNSSVITQPFGEGSLLKITSHKLDCKNFLQWSQSVLLVIKGRRKLGYITSEIQCSSIEDPSSQELDMHYVADWGDFEDNKKFKKHLEKECLYEFLDGLNKELDEELDMHYVADWGDFEDNKKFKKHLEKECLYEFLDGLNKELDEIAYNLVSFSKLTYDLHYTAKFSAKSCQIQEQGIERMIGIAKEDGGLHYFENDDRMERKATMTENNSSYVSNKDVIMWHCRLDEPMLSQLEQGLETSEENPLVPRPLAHPWENYSQDSDKPYIQQSQESDLIPPLSIEPSSSKVNEALGSDLDIPIAFRKRFLAGTAGPVCTGPFDVVKIRLMAQSRSGNAKYKGKHVAAASSNATDIFTAWDP